MVNSLQSALLPLGLAGGLIIALVTLVNTDFALIILIFSMLLSPEIPIAQVPERAVVIRIDDILLIFIFFTWLAKIAINKELGLFKKTPINRPLFFYLFACIFSTALAIILKMGEAKFSNAFFYILKIAEYFMLYFLVTNNVRDIKQIKKYTVCMLIVCFFVCIYGYLQTKSGGFGRVSAPFEGEHSEPNTLAGYLILMFALTGGIFLYARSFKQKFLLGSLAVFITLVFSYTFSRGGYIGFLAVYLTLLALSKRGKFVLLVLTLLVLILIPHDLSLKIIERVRTTFLPGKQYELLGKEVTLDWSASIRVEMARRAFRAWKKSPLLGYGITGLGFLEGQYTRFLAEIGIIGIGIFLWLMFRLFISVFKAYRVVQDEFVKGITLGFLAGLIGLLVTAGFASVFIIVRIMEPFWFLAALTVSLAQIIPQPQPQQIDNV